ncbi:hypothetical protein BGZ49_002865 [Haplosporangium sp. Z 27]|nr:hypothetical protein BGZ49_002865 [Haplosporangium sp. Z 27]
MKFTSILTLAAALCVVSAKSKPLDACGLLNKQASAPGGTLTYAAAKGCYESHAYDPIIATKVLDTLEKVLGNFYVFLDQAKVPSNGAGSPFDTPAVDLMKELEKIRQKKNWKNDYEFQTALTYLTFSLNDGHLAYQSSCYRTVSFKQPISLYAPVVNGSQSVRVFYVDTTISKKGLPKDPSSLIDCTVVTIDGQPALKAIQSFTDRTSAISKDPGVRLNDALASTSWNSDWSSSPGGFASRWEIPSKSSMDYTLQCGTGSKAKTVKLTVPWAVEASDDLEVDSFKNTQEYWNVQCKSYAPTSSVNAKDNKKRDDISALLPFQVPRRGDVQNGGPSKTIPAISLFRERGKISKPVEFRTDGRGESKGPAVISHAKLVKATSTTAFYRLLGSSVADTCVAVIATEEAYYQYANDYTDFVKGLQALEEQGCKKLILDMTNNGGGSIDFAYFVNLVFFPNAKPYFVEDLRDTTLVQAAAKQAIKYPKARSTFDARGYNSVATGKPFKDASMFAKGVNQKRGGSTTTFTQKNYFAYSCGSACTMIASRFAITQKVKTYSVGGISKRPLSYFSFPGGFVMNDGGIISDLESIHLKGKNVPQYSPVQSSTSLPVGEIYALNDSTIPLEYDAKYFAADVHLDQDPVSARHPDQIWLKIAKDFGKK